MGGQHAAVGSLHYIEIVHFRTDEWVQHIPNGTATKGVDTSAFQFPSTGAAQDEVDVLSCDKPMYFIQQLGY